MIESTDSFLFKIRLVAAGALIIVCLLILPFLLHSIWVPPKVQAANQPTETTDFSESPNAITRGMLGGADRLDKAASSTEQAVTNGVRSVADSISGAAVKSGKFIANSAANVATDTAKAASGGFNFVVDGTGSFISSVANISIVGAVIRPADNDKAEIPVIDPADTALANAPNHNPSEQSPGNAVTQNSADPVASWPMYGRVTAEFGIPHRPYQPTHTGIDISSGKGPGITPVKPFKPGSIIETVYSKAGLGNYVAVDHGEGMMSIYAHLSSTLVRVGQKVDKGTVLGHEGSTGASTGAHLHFEIRVNDEPVNPRQYISGQP